MADQLFAIRFVTRQDNVNDPRIKKFVKIFQESKAVRDEVHKLFGGEAKLYSLPWLNQ